jgi:hypothetical protein
VAIDVYKEWLGIPEDRRPPNHYELLRLVQFEDDTQKIQAHYKKLNAHVRKFATGQYSVQSQELLNELAKAMLCLTDAERKKAYDQSLGREFEPERSLAGTLTIGDELCERGILTREQIQEVEQYADQRGLSFRDAAVQMKLTDAETATQAYASELGRSYVDLAVMVPDEEVLDQVPRNVARRHSILPLFVDEDVVLVACADDPPPELEDELRLRFGLPICAVLATPRAINEAVAEHYAKGMREKAVDRTAESDSQADNAPQAAAKKKTKKRKSQLTEEERKQRKQIGILIACWSVIIPILLDQYLVRPMLFPQWSFSLVLTVLVAPVGVFFAWKNYIK